MPARHFLRGNEALPRAPSDRLCAAGGTPPLAERGVLLRCRDMTLLPQLLGALPGEECHLALTDTTFHSLVAWFRVAVLGARHLDAELRSWLQELPSGVRGGSLILALEHPGPVQRSDVVLTSLSSLPQAIARALSAEDGPQELLDRLLLACASRATGNPTAARAISLIQAGAGSIGTVEQLANRMHVQPWALRYHWRTTVGEHPPLRWLMDVVRLCNAVSGRHREPLFQAADRMGVHRRTLERLAQRYAGHSVLRLRRSPEPLIELLVRTAV